MDADIAGAPHQIVNHRTAHQFEPPGTGSFPDHDLGDIVGTREGENVVGNAAFDGRDRQGIGTQRLRKPQRGRNPVALGIAELQAPPGFDADGRPRRMQPVREALGVTDQAGGPRVFADANQNPLARGPWP